MRGICAAAFAALGLCGSGGPSGAQQDLKWTRYQNARFAVSVEYPSAIFAEPFEAANGDGVRFEPGRSLSLRIWGRYNALDQRPYEAVCLTPCAGETYRVDQPDSAITSGIGEGNMVYYKKCILRDEEFHCFDLRYVASMRQTFDAVAKRMSRTLR